MDDKEIKIIIDAIIKKHNIIKSDVQIFDSGSYIIYYTNEETLLMHKKY